MRYVLLACLLLIAIPAYAQPTETVLIDETLILYPGGSWEVCPTVERGILTVRAFSPPGRTGETARFLFRPNRQTVEPDAYLALPLDLDEVVASHTVEAGSYCYDVMITQQLPHPEVTTSINRPNKQVHVKVTHVAL